jgi:tRNA dimethylallyltransferase
MCGVPHHLLDVLEPNERANVRIFREMANNIAEDLCERSILPIVVGGTHYYVESLLFHRVSDELESNPSSKCPLPREFHEMSTHQDPYLQLQQLDPLIASTIHPNDSRRIQNALINHRQQVHPNEPHHLLIFI